MSIKQDLESITDANSVYTDFPMEQATSFKVGGPADYYVLPRDYSQVSQVITYCNEHNLDLYVIGKGTNLLISDRGLRGVVMRLDENMSEIRVADTTIIAQAGASLPRVSKIAQANGLSGLEFAAGIPGTVGGAVVMNAGAYGNEMKDVLTRVLAVTPQGQLVQYQASELELDYRSSIFQSNGNVVLEAEIELTEKDREDIREYMNELTRRRREKQPLDKASAGSTFKRPPRHYAGKLIEECNLRGVRQGGAMVSEKHCGFVVNDNKATAQEIYNLIHRVRASVLERHNVELQPEVKIWGEFDSPES
ncbi:MAG: UDP-N-acetylmuramate dehydrogenase [Firmicutes bacterium]|nr:UDP-N-acetylmuramate dehydrogenase [Bacillota bacterium]